MSNRMQARARSTDPETSHSAAFEVEATGKAKVQRQACLDEVTRKQGQTAAEIAAMCKLERHVPSRRLPELRDAGLVRNGQKRICAVVNRESMTWYLVVAEEQQDLFGE